MTIVEKAKKIFKVKPKIVFVYGVRYKDSGSTVMRTFQLAKMYGKYVDGYSVFTAPHTKRFRNSTLIISKGAIQSLNVQALKNLKSENNILLFDPVDSTLDKEKVKYADAIICASKAAYDEYRKIFNDTPAFIVDHHVDPRIQLITKPDKIRSLSIGYFGELVNTKKTNKISELVDFVGVDTSRKSDDWFSQLYKYNMHYTVRNSEDVGVHKPFLKGFTAAHLNSNVIAHESQTDIIRWLGNDYPYLVKGTLDEDNILRTLEYAKETYESDIWTNALKRMQFIKDATSEKTIINQLHKAVSAVQKSFR